MLMIHSSLFWSEYTDPLLCSVPTESFVKKSGLIFYWGCYKNNLSLLVQRVFQINSVLLSCLVLLQGSLNRVFHGLFCVLSCDAMMNKKLLWKSNICSLVLYFFWVIKQKRESFDSLFCVVSVELYSIKFIR